MVWVRCTCIYRPGAYLGIDCTNQVKCAVSLPRPIRWHLGKYQQVHIPKAHSRLQLPTKGNEGLNFLIPSRGRTRWRLQDPIAAIPEGPEHIRLSSPRRLVCRTNHYGAYIRKHFSSCKRASERERERERVRHLTCSRASRRIC